MRRDSSRRVAATRPEFDAAKGKDWAKHGPVAQRMEPNERGWLEAKDTFFDDERVWKTKEEIEEAEGPSGARS